MEHFSCAIQEGKRFEKGPCLYEKRGTTEGNPTCPQCNYYRTHLTPAKTETPRPSDKSPERKCEKRNPTQFGGATLVRLTGEMAVKGTTRERNNKENLRLLQSISILKEVLGTTAEIEVREKLFIAKLQRKNSFDGKPELEYLCWFTEETRNEFKKPLKNYGRARIESFINRIESDIGNFIKVKLDLSGQQDFRTREVEDAIKTLERANGYLLKICSGRLKVPYQPKYGYAYKFKSPDDPLSGDLYEEVKATCNIKSKVVLRSLPGLLQDLKSAVSIERRKRGRPNADADDLAFQIAGWFKEIIGPPRPLSGPFPEIIRRCFEICEIGNGNDRTRAIRHAIKRFSHP